MNDRDELISHLSDVLPVSDERIAQAADWLLDAGYRKVRTISTAEELDALAVGSVILDAGRHSYQKSHLTGWTGCDSSTVYRDSDLLELPALVLWTPEAQG